MVWQEQTERDSRCILIKRAQNLDQVDKLLKRTLKKEETLELSHHQEIHSHPGLQMADTHLSQSCI